VSNAPLWRCASGGGGPARRDVEHMRVNPCSRRMSGELRCSDGEVEQEVDAKACRRVEEVRRRRPALSLRLADQFPERAESRNLSSVSDCPSRSSTRSAWSGSRSATARGPSLASSQRYPVISLRSIE
jgi:hypothetical protein